MTASAAPTGQALDVVRSEVRALLSRSDAFKKLPVAERKSFAENLVRVGSYLADPGWMDASTPVRAEALAASDATRALAKEQKPPPREATDFDGAALKAGTDAFERLVNAVDFPAFVSGLVQGVFQAVVDSSIQQMRAYGELMAASAMSVDQFANSQLTDGEAREQLLQRFPNALKAVGDDGSARLAMNDDSDVDVGAQFGMEGLDISDEEGEQRLVGAMKHEMAAQRQQMMATMVLLGIHRIVVTNGRINAKVLFNVDASDTAKRKTRNRFSSEHDIRTKASIGGGFVGSIFGGPKGSIQTQHKISVSNAQDNDNESKAKLKAQLSGEVRLNFKSETFPLERLADQVTIGSLNTRADPNNLRAGAAPQGTGTTPAAPAPATNPAPATR